MKLKHLAIALIAVLTIVNTASPTLAARDEQAGDYIKIGKCKDMNPRK